jgi:putative tricarboxylic transport membrane protein
VWSAVALGALAGGYLIVNRAYPLDTLATPGPGVFPLGVGLLLIGLATAQAIAVARSRASKEPFNGPTLEAADVMRGRMLALAAVLVAYAAAAGVIGFLSASFGVVVASSRLLGARDWLRPLGLALAVTGAAHLIFVVWLGVPFPTGRLR